MNTWLWITALMEKGQGCQFECRSPCDGQNFFFFYLPISFLVFLLFMNKIQKYWEVFQTPFLSKMVQLYVKDLRNNAPLIKCSLVGWVMSSHPGWYFQVPVVNVKLRVMWLSRHLSFSFVYTCFYKVRYCVSTRGEFCLALYLTMRQTFSISFFSKSCFSVIFLQWRETAVTHFEVSMCTSTETFGPENRTHT